jgi:hypothetical protein
VNKGSVDCVGCLNQICFIPLISDLLRNDYETCIKQIVFNSLLVCIMARDSEALVLIVYSFSSNIVLNSCQMEYVSANSE